MTYHKEKKQRNQLLAARRKPYVAPWSNNIPIETATLLMNSPAGIEENKVGEKLYEEKIDDN